MQLTSEDGRIRAAVDPLGGGLRELVVDGTAIVESYPEGERPPHAAGAVLFPWPNRVRDGRWSSGGVDYQLSISEPQLNNASHGFVLTQHFEAESNGPDSVTLRTEVKDAAGYPFYLRLALTYRLLADGIHVAGEVRNAGSARAPFALGFHPYLRVGEVPTPELTLRVPASEILDVDDQLIPVGSRAVAGSKEDPNDLPLATALLNHCYGGLKAAEDGFRYQLEAPDGRTVELRTDPEFAWVQVFTTSIFPHPEGLVTAVAVEPMTAPPNALATGQDLIWLEPGASWSAGWSVHLL